MKMQVSKLDSITITALDDVYFNFKQSVQAGAFYA